MSIATISAQNGERFDVLSDASQKVVKLRRVRRDGEEAWSQEFHEYGNAGALALRGGRLFVATYRSGAPGCHVAAVETDSGSVLWRRHLRGPAPVLHSKYSNVVTLTSDDECLTVEGVESGGPYREMLDMASGDRCAKEVSGR